MTDKLEGIKLGDRVRVTFEGIALADSDDRRFCIMARGGSLWVEPDLGATPTAERIEPPLKVNDTVRGKEINSARRGKLLAIHHSGVCWVEWAQSPYNETELDTAFMHDLERADA